MEGVILAGIRRAFQRSSSSFSAGPTFPSAYGAPATKLDETLSDVEGALKRSLFRVDFLLQLEDGKEKRFGARRAAGNVDVNGKHLIAALHDAIVVEDTARSGAGAHGDNPLRLRHLIVKKANDRCHFLREAAGDDHEVGLPRRRAEDLSAKAGDIEAGGSHGHHFDRAAGESEAQGPDGAFPGQFTALS